MRVIWSPYYGAYGVTWSFHMVTILLRSIIFMDEIGQFGYLVVRQKYQVSQRFFITMLMFFVTMLMLMFLAVQNSSMGDHVTDSLTE